MQTVLLLLLGVGAGVVCLRVGYLFGAMNKDGRTAAKKKMLVNFSSSHYIDIARLLKGQYTGNADQDAMVDRVVDEFTVLFGVDNPNFSTSKFLSAVRKG